MNTFLLIYISFGVVTIPATALGLIELYFYIEEKTR